MPDYKQEAAADNSDPSKLIHKIVGIIYALIVILNFPSILFTLIMGPATLLIALWALLCVPTSRGFFDNHKTLIGYLILFFVAEGGMPAR